MTESIVVIAAVVLIPILHGYFSGGSSEDNEKGPSILQPIFGGAVFLSGFGVVIYQAYIYLKNGLWHPISSIDALVLLEVEWAISPSDWFGIWKILNQIPLSILVIIFSLFIFHNYDKQKAEHEFLKSQK